MFTCYYWTKMIQGLTIVVDERHLAHSECANEHKSLGLKSMKAIRAEVVKKWEEIGLLDGLTAMSPEKSKKMEELFGCCKSSKLTE